MADHGTEADTFTPLASRQYQLELLEHVTYNNGIIYLPTGAGKTYVAILALKRFSTQMDKTIAEGGKRGIFMCNTVELARQQAIEIRKHTNLKVGLYLGERDVDNWLSKKWQAEIDENQILVGTVQIFVNIVSANFIKITDLSIVIIDECHHGTKMHPMHEFMRLFKLVPDEALLPRVIGLTGVLLKGNKLSNIIVDLQSLEATFRSRIVTITSRNEFLNVMIHATCPDEKMILYQPIYDRTDVIRTIESTVGDCLRVVNGFDLGAMPLTSTKGLAAIRESSKKITIKNMLNDLLYHLRECGMYCSLFVLENIEMKLRQSETVAMRQLNRFVSTQMETVRNSIFTCIKQNLDRSGGGLITNEDSHKVDVIYNFSSTKLACLLRYLENLFSGKERSEISCLIFVDRRLTAKSICSVIQRFVSLKVNLKDTVFPEFMVGYNSMLMSSVENVLEKKWNRQVLSDFRKGICNMIICSSVLEEGIDVQSCNYVLVFDPLKTFNSYIQTKGRARQKNAIYAYFVENTNQFKVIAQIRKYQETHEAIREFLFERTLNTTSHQECIEFDDGMSPIVTPKGACLLPSSALAMINRYCQSLPWDSFGAILPQFKKFSSSGIRGIIVSVKLPLQSYVKEEILSDPMASVKLAKISAALKACRRLYEVGELNENLLPTTKADVINLISDVLFSHWEKQKDNVVSNKEFKAKTRLYEKKCPDELYDSIPVIGQTCFAYEIFFTPEFEMNEYNDHVIEALKSKSNYAILLRKPLPELAGMPLFMQQGLVNVRIAEKPLQFCINTDEELQQLRKYHFMVMRDLLKCWRSYYVEDKRNKQNSFLIAPLSSGTINWCIVKRFEQLKPIAKPTLNERQTRNYRAEDWLGKIVGKWYSPNSSERFIVTKVHVNHSPLTLFPDDKLGKITYAEFFQTRYGNTIESTIVNQDQFLIEVKPLTARLNFLNNVKSNNTILKRDQKLILLPELCHNFEHPGDLWLKALFLPSILYRLPYMLHAEYLRKRINSFLGLSNSFKDYKPKSLVIDRSLRRAIDNDGKACPFEQCKEEHVLLPSTTSNINEEIVFEICDRSVSNELWKAYMKPRNMLRQSKSIFPDELQYCQNLTQRMQEHFEKTHPVEAGYLNQQFEIPKAVLYRASNFVNESLTSAISYISLEEKRRINILERSKSNMSSAEQYEFLAALTNSAANDIFDMERFELLGDSFLKFAVSLYLANKFPKFNEGFLTHLKSKLVSNRNLLYCQLETDIPTRICSSSFFIHEWLPPLISLPENFLNSFERDANMDLLLSSDDLCKIELSDDEVKNGYCNEEHFLEFTKASQRRELLNSVLLDSSLQSSVNASGKLNYCTYKDVRADKTVADTLEALLGVCVKNYGFHDSFRMLEFFGIVKTQPGDKPLTNLLDLKLESNLLRTEISTKEIDAFLVNHQYLEQNLGYKFRDRSYLLQALTHPSYPTNRLTGCYQQLEFIGDAILDILVSSYIFERYESMTPGMLTDLRSALVNNVTLGCICVRYRFHLFLLAENSLLAASIRKFAEFQESQNYKVTDMVYILMEENDTVCSKTASECYGYNDNDEGDENLNSVDFKANISANVEVPKALGDIVEALIAAVYLDSRNLQTTWDVIYRMLAPELHAFGQKVPINPVRQLYEHPSASPQFSDAIVNNDATMVKCAFSCHNKSVVVNGFGANKLQAKKSAAKHALQILAKI